MITVSTEREHLARLGREQEIERLGRRDQDVRRLAEHRRALRCGVSPVRTATRRAADCEAGERRRARFRSTSSSGPSAARRRAGAGPRPARSASRSMPERKAASVLPEPVGAWMRTLAPLAIAGQPSACAGVGASKTPSNHARVRSPNTSSASTVSRLPSRRRSNKCSIDDLYDRFVPNRTACTSRATTPPTDCWRNTRSRSSSASRSTSR